MKKLIVISLLLVFLVGMSGCSNQPQPAAGSKDAPQAQSTGTTEQATPKKTVIKYPNTQWYDSVYIAAAKGYFKEQGIEIQFVGELPAGQIVPAVAARKVDFGLRHTPLVAIARSQGALLKIVASGTQTLPDYPHMRYVVRKDSAVKDIKDLAGKKVALNSLGACSEFVSREFLKRNNIKGEINFTVLPDAQQEQALEQGLIDVAIVHAPFSKKAVKNPALKELANDYAMDEGMSGMCPYFTHEDFIKENPEAVKGFVTAVAKASDWAKAHEDEAKQIIAAKLGINVGDVEPWAYYPHQVIQKDAVKWWVDYLEREGKLKPGQVKVEDLYTNQFNTNAPKESN